MPPRRNDRPAPPTPRRTCAVFAAVAIVLPLAARAEPPCLAPSPGRSVPFSPGERLEFELSSIGAKIGTFSLQVQPGRGPDAWVVEAKAATAPFAANFYEVGARSTARLGRALDSRGYDENATEAGVNRTTAIELPATSGRLKVRATKQGDRDDYVVDAPAGTRDLLSVLYAARAMALAPGAELCVPVFGARRMWTLRMKVIGRETVRTPAGEFRTLHLSGQAVRLDRAGPTREVHIWLSDDAERIPVAAFGQVQNKPVQAELVRRDPGRRRLARASPAK